jgi:[ribosomal protein S18]-alanine N-acetyltransferase
MKTVIADITRIGDIFSVETRCFDHAWTSVQIFEELNHENSVILISYYNDKPTGFVMFRCEMDSNELMKIAVLPEFRKKGIASSLYDDAEKIALDKNRKDIFLEVDETNLSAISLYSKKGFVEISRRKNYYHNKAAICMIKRIVHDN